DRETLVIQQIADPPDQQHLMVLVVAPVAAALHWLELGELLLPVAQHVRFHAAQLADLTDGEVAFGRDSRQAVGRCVHANRRAKSTTSAKSSDFTRTLPPAGRRPEQSLSTYGWREMSPRCAP